MRRGKTGGLYARGQLAEMEKGRADEEELELERMLFGVALGLQPLLVASEGRVVRAETIRLGRRALPCSGWTTQVPAAAPTGQSRRQQRCWLQKAKRVGRR